MAFFRVDGLTLRNQAANNQNHSAGINAEKHF